MDNLQFAEVAGYALEETRRKFKATWIRADKHQDAIEYALGLFCGIALRRLRGEPDPDLFSTEKAHGQTDRTADR